MDENNAINVVENLIETSKDAQKGYQDAAEHVKRPDLKSYFNEQNAEGYNLHPHESWGWEADENGNY